jgi:DNA-binding XRE family transcriptional regulator
MSSEVIYNRIAMLRAERGISRRELADALGVHYQTVGYLERGEYSPSLYLALRPSSARKQAQAIPSRWAMAAASVRLLAPSLPRMFDTCTLAVFGAVNSATAISLLLRPAAISRSTSRSRLVKTAVVIAACQILA